MRKYGKPAAFFFAILGAAIGAAIGYKVPGVGKVVATVVGAIVGFVGFAAVGLFLYFIYKCRYNHQRDEWEQNQRSHQPDIDLIDEIERKKSGLNDIRSQLNDLEEGNMVHGRPILVQQTTEYLNY